MTNENSQVKKNISLFIKRFKRSKSQPICFVLGAL